MRHAEAASLVQGRAFDAMRDAIDEFGGDWAEMIEARLVGARRDFLDHVDALARSHAELAKAVALSGYVRSEGGRYRPGASHVPLRRSGDSDVVVAKLLDARRTLGDTPEPATPKIPPVGLAVVA